MCVLLSLFCSFSLTLIICYFIWDRFSDFLFIFDEILFYLLSDAASFNEFIVDFSNIADEHCVDYVFFFYLMFITRFGWLSIKRSFLFCLWYRLHFVWYITLTHSQQSILWWCCWQTCKVLYINCSWNCHTRSIAIQSHQPQFLRCISVFFLPIVNCIHAIAIFKFVFSFVFFMTCFSLLLYLISWNIEAMKSFSQLKASNRMIYRAIA